MLKKKKKNLEKKIKVVLEVGIENIKNTLKNHLDIILLEEDIQNLLIEVVVGIEEKRSIVKKSIAVEVEEIVLPLPHQDLDLTIEEDDFNNNKILFHTLSILLLKLLSLFVVLIIGLTKLYQIFQINSQLL